MDAMTTILTTIMTTILTKILTTTLMTTLTTNLHKQPWRSTILTMFQIFVKYQKHDWLSESLSNMDPSDASASKNLLIGLIKSGETRGKHKGGFNEPSSVSVILKIVLKNSLFVFLHLIFNFAETVHTVTLKKCFVTERRHVFIISSTSSCHYHY